MESLIKKLGSFNKEEREKALAQLASETNNVSNATEFVNLHYHTFYSYNAENWSPSRIAYEAYKSGLYATGIIDFDTLDGQQEFLKAGEILGLRTNVGVETRAFLDEYSDKEIDSPGEPGVSYIAGAGFARELIAGSPEQQKLQSFVNEARKRNIALIERINAKLSDVKIDYERDVLTLTPSGNATERHIVSAYITRSEALFAANNKLYDFWAQVLNKPTNEIKELFFHRHGLEDLIRTRLVKKGGLGYVQPTDKTFLKVEDFFKWVKNCGAIPMESWLDGTSEGERNGRELLELSVSKGCSALNIIPDRNWNISNQEIKKRKLAELYNIVDIANSMNLPLHIGTEMNKSGQPFFDNLHVQELKPVKESFIRGARIITGHSILSRFSNAGYLNDKLVSDYPDVKKRNDFLNQVGSLPPVNRAIADYLRQSGELNSYKIITESAIKRQWLIKTSVLA